MTAPEGPSPARNREHVIITRWGVDWPWKRRRAERRQADGGAGTGSALLVVASVLLAADGAAMGVVSWHAQFAFVFAAKQQVMASALEALGLDAGAVIFALLGIALARLQRRAVVERMLVVACAAGGASLRSPATCASPASRTACWANRRSGSASSPPAGPSNASPAWWERHEPWRSSPVPTITTR